MGVAKVIAKNSLFNFVATSSDVALNLVVSIVLARSLGTEEYGLYAFLMWFAGFALLITNLGIGEMAKRFIAEANGRGSTEEQKAIVRLTLLLRAVLALIVFFVVLTFSGYWANLFGQGENQFLFIILAFSILPNVLYLAFIPIFSGFQRYNYRAYLMLLTNPPRAILIIALMAMGFGIQAVLLGNLSIWVLGVFVGLFFLRRLISLKDLIATPRLSSSYMKTALKYTITVAGISGINYFLWSRGEVMFLGYFRPAVEVGFYTLASKLPSMSMLLIPSVFGVVLLPAISEQIGRGDMYKLRLIYQTSARYLMMLALPLAAAGIALAHPIVTTLYGSDYAPVVILMQVLFIPFAMMGMAHAAISVIYGINEPAYILKVGVILTCVTLGLNIWLIPPYGAMGAAIGSSIARIIALPLYIRFASKKIGANWPLGDALRIMLASLSVGIVLFLLQNYLNDLVTLVLALPIGISIYIAILLPLRIIHPQDITILKQIQASLPHALRKNFALLIGVLERFVNTKQASDQGPTDNP